MEVLESNGSPPFQREVREWQHIDPNTGALLVGRLEADRWIKGPQNAYGKVVDSTNMSQPNGVNQSQCKQLEVLHARTSSGSLQVVRAQTQTVQSSSSRWSSSTLSTGTKTTQSLAGQRFSIPLHVIAPQGLITEPSSKLSSLMRNSTASSDSSRKSSPDIFGSVEAARRNFEDIMLSPSTKMSNGADDGSFQNHNTTRHFLRRTNQQREVSPTSDNSQQLHRGRSISNEDLSSSEHWDHQGDKENGEDFQEWRRVSKIRRSFQTPKSSSPAKTNVAWPSDLPENIVSVSRIRQELENGQSVNTVNRNSNIDLIASASLKGSSSLTKKESVKSEQGTLNNYNNYDIKSMERDETRNSAEAYRVSRSDAMDNTVVKSPTDSTPPHNTNSLEKKARQRDTTSSDWYLRRKSYGFENMVPPSNSMFRHETSTDSGIGQSSELANWSPTDNTPRGTVITLGNDNVSSPQTSITVLHANGGVVQRYKQLYDTKNEVSRIKRHSIAVDESKYVRDTKSSVNMNGFYIKEVDSTQTSTYEENARRQKRVEFCKTEVHFAAESGRVNIVETDGKPPSTSRLRRRRQNSVGSVTNAYLEAINSGKPIIHFGDDVNTQTAESSQQQLAIEESNQVTVITNVKPDLVLPCTVQEDSSESQADEVSIRGILKNKPVKPKPYHLGENVENTESLWGVRLRPVSADLSAPKVDEIEEGKLDVVPVNPTSSSSSVAERVRIVEERKAGVGYSTKIKLNLSDFPESCDTTDLFPETQYSMGRRKSTHFEMLSECLKSTSLIMKTIRSQSCYEDPSFIRLPELLNQPLRSESCITMPGSGFNIRQTAEDNPKSHSLLIKSINNSFDAFESRIRGNSEIKIRNDTLEMSNESTSSKLSSSSSLSQISASSFQYEKAIGATDTSAVESFPRKIETQALISNDEQRKPIAAPRIKVIGSSNTVTHQLSQLRRMYDAAEADIDNESSIKADEEVKRYLSYRNSASTSSLPPEEVTSEISGSWSRIKAKRYSVKHQEFQNGFQELPDSNVMTIELHSPTNSLQRNGRNYTRTSTNEKPVPKARQIAATKATSRQIAAITTVEKKELSNQITPTNEKLRESPLKVETGGTRKLKDHELLFFGVKLGTSSNQSQNSISRNNNVEKTIQMTQVTSKMDFTTSNNNSQNGKLSSDKPDLLRHSSTTISDSDSKNSINEVFILKDNVESGPVYENLHRPRTGSDRKNKDRIKPVVEEGNIGTEHAMKLTTSDKSARHKERQVSQRTADVKIGSMHSKQKTVSVSNTAERRLSTKHRPSTDSPIDSHQNGQKDAHKSQDYINMSKTHREDCPLSKERHPHRSTSKSTEGVHHNGIVDLHHQQRHHHRSHSSSRAEQPLRRSQNSRKSGTSSRPKETERLVVKVDENQQITKSATKVSENQRKTTSGKVWNDSLTKSESLRSTKSDKSDTSKTKVSSQRSSNGSRKMLRSKPTSAVKSSPTSSSLKRSSRNSPRK